MFPSPDKRDADTSATNAPPRATTAGVGWRAGRGCVSVALVWGREHTRPHSLPPSSHSRVAVSVWLPPKPPQRMMLGGGGSCHPCNLVQWSKTVSLTCPWRASASCRTHSVFYKGQLTQVICHIFENRVKFMEQA